MSTISRAPLRLAILISGRGSNMAAIARQSLARQLAATVSVVIADRPEATGLATARDLGIEAQLVDRGCAADRGAFETALRTCIDAHEPDLIVLAGFMRVLSQALVERYAGRMLNIHPSLLPRYRGLHTHRRVLEAGEAIHGATVHFVTAELDGGPAILQSRVPVRPHDTESTLAARVQATEHVIYPRAIGWIACGRLAWNDGHPLLDGRTLEAPVVEDFSE